MEVYRKPQKVFLVMCAYFLWVSVRLLYTTQFLNYLPENLLSKGVRLVVYFFLILEVLHRRIYSSRIWVGAAIVALVLVVSYVSRTTIFIDIVIWMILLSNRDPKEIIQVTLLAQTAMIALTVLGAFAGVIPDIIVTRDGSDVLRHSFGFNYCTYISKYFFFMLLEIMYLLRKKIRFWQLAVLFAVNVWIYLTTLSRTTFFMSFILFPAMWIVGKRKDRPLGPVTKTVTTLSLPVCAVGSVVLSLLYKYEGLGWKLVNAALSGRLRLASNAIHQYGFSLLGKNIEWVAYLDILEGVAKETNYVDNVYVHILVNFGVIALILVCLGFQLLAQKAIRENDLCMCVICVALAVQNVIDPQLLYPWYNPFVLMLGIWLCPLIRRREPAIYFNREENMSRKKKRICFGPGRI